MTFVEAVIALAEDITGYMKGRSGENGLCDCIGLVIGALRMIGLVWTGTHGTNYAIRYQCRSPSLITGIDSLHVGDLVFKKHDPGEDGYDAATIKKSYSGHPDQADYYHVGVVVSVYPLHIVHCSTGGIHHDTKIGKWEVRTTLLDLPEEGEEPVARSYFVSGGVESAPIRMRKTASKSAAVVAEIPQGKSVDYLATSGAWAKVIYEGKTGYVMSEFLHSTETGTVDTEFSDPVTAELRDLIEEWAEYTEKANQCKEKIFDIMGRG